MRESVRFTTVWLSFVVLCLTASVVWGRDRISATAGLVVISLFLIIGVVISESLRLTRSARPQLTFMVLVRQAIDLLRSHGVQLYGLFVVCYVPFLVVWIATEKPALAITSQAALAAVLAELVLFQMCSFVRTGQTLWFTASAAHAFGDWLPESRPSAQQEPLVD